MKKFSLIKNGVPIIIGMLLTFIITVLLAYFFESFFWFGLLVYIPLYFIYKKTSYTVRGGGGIEGKV